MNLMITILHCRWQFRKYTSISFITHFRRHGILVFLGQFLKKAHTSRFYSDIFLDIAIILLTSNHAVGVTCYHEPSSSTDNSAYLGSVSLASLVPLQLRHMSVVAFPVTDNSTVCGLRKYQDVLLALYEENPSMVTPQIFQVMKNKVSI